jgi:hypothetical protein
MFVQKIDVAFMTKTWGKLIQAPNGGGVIANAIGVRNGGDVNVGASAGDLAAGATGPTLMDHWILDFTSAGVPAWERRLDVSGRHDVINGIAVDPAANGPFYLGGSIGDGVLNNTSQPPVFHVEGQPVPPT